MSDEEDPEVVADLRLRAYTAASRKGMSEAQFGAAIKAAATPKIIDRVPCRNRCGAVVSWTEEAEDTFQTFNRQLARKMEAELDKTKIVFCNSCRIAGGLLSAERNRKQVDFIAQLIRELKNGNGIKEDREKEIIEKLKKAGHPDVEGLQQAIRDKAATKSGGRKFSKGAL